MTDDNKKYRIFVIHKIITNGLILVLKVSSELYCSIIFDASISIGTLITVLPLGTYNYFFAWSPAALSCRPITKR